MFLDFETRSTVDLPEVGGYVYAQHPTTEILCCVAAIVDRDEVTVHCWAPFPGPPKQDRCAAPPLPARGYLLPRPAGLASPEWFTYWNTEEPPPDVLDAIAYGAPLIAHNADGFDRHVWEGLGWPDPPGGWIDTVHLARRASLPGKLELLGAYCYGVGESKDKAGRKLMLTYSDGKRTSPDQRVGEFKRPAPAILNAIVRYCARDVLLIVALWFDLALGDPHQDDDVLAFHRKINRVGVPFDLDYARRLLRAEERVADAALAEAARVLERDVVDVRALVSSPQQLAKWLGEQGIEVEDTQKETLDQLTVTDNPIAEAVLTCRRTVVNVVRGKLQRILDMSLPDGGDGAFRMVDPLVYYGAQATGRWSGRGPQIQNFTRPTKKQPEPEECRTIAEIQGTLRKCVRAPLRRALVTIDASQIEARGLLYLADDQAGLDVYRRGEDAYRVRAAAIYGTTLDEVTDAMRAVGKVAVLSLGYQGGVRALTNYAAGLGLDLRQSGMEPIQIVEGWRDAHTPVAGFRVGKQFQPPNDPDAPPIEIRSGGLWRGLQAAFTAVALGGAAEAVYGKIRFERVDGDVFMELPSGRALQYRDVRLETVPDKFSDDGSTKEALTYAHPKGSRRQLYGGLLTENATQAVSRDVLAEAAVRLDRAGKAISFHVHDELVCEVDAAAAEAEYNEIVEIANEPPAWADGFPIKFSGAWGERWAK